MVQLQKKEGKIDFKRTRYIFDKAKRCVELRAEIELTRGNIQTARDYLNSDYAVSPDMRLDFENTLADAQKRKGKLEGDLENAKSEAFGSLTSADDAALFEKAIGACEKHYTFSKHFEIFHRHFRDMLLLTGVIQSIAGLFMPLGRMTFESILTTSLAFGIFFGGIRTIEYAAEDSVKDMYGRISENLRQDLVELRRRFIGRE